ncbi:MAG: TonB-dependent receptor [Candidatus Kapabacteria bacterium]|nr:TonB-dependent receptor [Candidatus Kapabacteria bacterium]
MKKILIIVLLINVISAYSQPERKDSLKSYRLGEIEIYETKSQISQINKASVVDVPYYIIQSSDVLSASELQMYLPSGVIRTNSRGESMLFLRGTGERQLGLFFDGMAMNIPWDNRLDLTFVPVDIIGNIRLNLSSSSMFYGPNVLGGAVSISTIERIDPGFGLSLKLQGGDGNTQNISLLHDGKIGDLNYIANISYMKTDGFLMSKNAPDSLGNQNLNSALRTNSQQKRINAYVRGEYHFSQNTITGLSLSYTNQSKGTPPETFAGKDARFWIYPDRSRLALTFNGIHNFSNDLSVKATFWYDIFSQEINGYTGIDYKTIKETQKDDDITIGTRLSINYNLAENHSLSLIFNGFTTNHKQTVNKDPETEYSQNTISTGLEYFGSFNRFEIKAGAGLDYNSTPKTGLFKEAEGTSQNDFAGFLSLRYIITDNIAVFAGTGRRTRFPSMREQYDGALNAFKTNPDLKAETGLLNEVGFVYTRDKIDFKATAFYNIYEGLIERIRLSKEQDSLRRRMRVNYSDATISGVDLNLSFRPFMRMLLEGYFTYMSYSAEQNGKKIEQLVQKPDILAGFNLNYLFSFGLKPKLEIEYTGKQFDTDPVDNTKYVSIDPSFILNFRLSYSFNISDFVYSEIFVRLNNITDEYRLSQLGLPAPGRTFYAGLSLRL